MLKIRRSNLLYVKVSSPVKIKKKTNQEFVIAYNTIAAKSNVDLFTFLKFI